MHEDERLARARHPDDRVAYLHCFCMHGICSPFGFYAWEHRKPWASSMHANVTQSNTLKTNGYLKLRAVRSTVLPAAHLAPLSRLRYKNSRK
ncbi:protein of unknown function (plasmid) [Agrobacterium pusense]|uniref:Uncharacterized protein n=1 Tax=Agrobacterium pusense TaxID=648995 RepID=U4Q3T2_9HYPH|nr:protein of unknown function [Agrobacterium pusense]